MENVEQFVCYKVKGLGTGHYLWPGGGWRKLGRGQVFFVTFRGGGYFILLPLRRGGRFFKTIFEDVLFITNIGNSKVVRLKSVTLMMMMTRCVSRGRFKG